MERHLTSSHDVFRTNNFHDEHDQYGTFPDRRHTTNFGPLIFTTDTTNMGRIRTSPHDQIRNNHFHDRHDQYGTYADRRHTTDFGTTIFTTDTTSMGRMPTVATRRISEQQFSRQTRPLWDVCRPSPHDGFRRNHFHDKRDQYGTYADLRHTTDFSPSK